MNWFKQHLNLTLIVAVVGTYLLTMITFAPAETTEQGRSVVGSLIQLVNPTVSSETVSWFYLPIWLALMLPAEGWVLSNKDRSLWHLLWAITPFGWIVFLCLKNRTERPTGYLGYPDTKESKIGPIRKARTGFGRFVQVVGVILWLGCGLLMFVWALYVLFSTFGVWTIFVGLFLFPITYTASIFIIWFSTGVFPSMLLAPYILSFVGLVIVAAGGAISGED